MKFTWFSGTTIRVHIGGQIFVVDPDGAPSGIDRAELVSGADRVLRLADADGALATIDPAGWRRRPMLRAIDEETALPPVHVFRIGGGAMLIEAVGEPPLVLIAGDVPPFGRWADDAVVLLFGDGEAMAALAEGLLDAARPRLLVLANTESAVDFVIAALREHLGGAGLVAMEPGLALEV